jgi:hypothetical protein
MPDATAVTCSYFSLIMPLPWRYFVFGSYGLLSMRHSTVKIATPTGWRLPQPQKGSFRFRALGLERIGVYMDDLFLCPKCGSFFFEKKAPYIFDVLRNRPDSFEVTMDAPIASRANAAEFVIAECAA